jgi:hypothetical protein
MKTSKTTAGRADGSRPLASYTLAPARSRSRSGFAWRWTKRLTLLGVGLFVALVVVHGMLGWRAAAAWEADLAAYRAAGDPILASDFVGPAVPDAENAAVAVRALAKGIDVQSEAWQAFDGDRNTVHPAGTGVRFPLTADERAVMDRVVGENVALLRGLPAALARPRVDWGMSTTSPVMLNADMSHLSPARSAGRVLMAAAAHAAGDDDAALGHLTTLLALSRVVDRQPFLISHLVSLGIGALAAEAATGLAPSLLVTDESAEGNRPGLVVSDADFARVGPPPPRPASRARVAALIAAFLDDTDLVVTRRRAIEGERMSAVDAALAVSDGRLALTGVSGPIDARRQWAAKASGYTLRPMALNDARIMARHLTAVRDASAAPDFPSCAAACPRESIEELTAPHQLHMLASVLLPAWGRAAQQDYKAIADRRMTAVALAARLYALDHDGRLPPTLGDLVPRYLPAVPIDPLTAGKPLGYRPDGDRPVVYSVGENGRDDGGTEVTPQMSWRQKREQCDEVRQLRHQPRPAEPGAGDPDPVLPPEPVGPAFGPKF